MTTLTSAGAVSCCEGRFSAAEGALLTAFTSVEGVASTDVAGNAEFELATSRGLGFGVSVLTGGGDRRRRARSRYSRHFLALHC